MRGRDCERRRELFLVSSCVSHSVEKAPPVKEESNTSSVTQIDALKIISPMEDLLFKYVRRRAHGEATWRRFKLRGKLFLIERALISCSEVR